MPEIIITILIILLVLGLVFCFSFTFLVARIVYKKTLQREKPDGWSREQCSEPGTEELEMMWQRGIDWAKTQASYIKELEIKSKDGLKLVGQLFDYGFDKTVIILPGRRETLVYSYYYAKPYKDNEVNVLVIDQRAHGLSEGTYSTCGIKEADDVVLWMVYLHEELNQKSLYLHGICVGSCVASIAASKFKENYLKGVVFDSNFVSYKDIYKSHYIEHGHALFPVFYQIWIWFFFLTGCYIKDARPIKYMPYLTVPVIFIWGEQDVYCLPEQNDLLFDKRGSKNKQRVVFENAAHSRVRLSDEVRYDALIGEFLAKN